MSCRGDEKQWCLSGQQISSFFSRLCHVEKKATPVDIEAVKHEDRIIIEVETYFGSTQKNKQRGGLRKSNKCTRLSP